MADEKPPDVTKEYETLKAQHKELSEKFEKLQASQKPPPPEDKELIEKARLQREADEKKSGDSKALEAAIRFDLKAKEFLSTNASLLPKDVEEIFKTAEKEKYDNALEKDAAIKSGIVQSFFSVQANLDLLTASQKNQLEDYLKLTKTGKQEKAQSIYDSIFEPTFEMLKRVKKAEALQKGVGDGSDDALIEKRMARAKKHFLREKSQ